MNKTAQSNINKEFSSFRDPDGFLFWENGELYRQINYSYKENYELFLSSGLYKKLSESNQLISHTEIAEKDESIYKLIKPELITFISYPYEWSFSQLKDSALLTLQIQKTALDHGMSLKDASAYNIQFKSGKPVLIDTLSFEKYEEGKPWQAYKQFCQHFLAPLALMSYKDIRLNQLLKNYIDGVPLDLAGKLLPFKAKLNFSLLVNIVMHSKSQKHFENKNVEEKEVKISRYNLYALIDDLQSCIKKLKFPARSTEWGEYYSFTNYSDSAGMHKKQIVEKYLDDINPSSLWDLGANNGFYTRIASNKGLNTIAFDIDEVAVEKNYQEIKRNKEKNILPLLLDLTNPSPSIGWANDERKNVSGRNLPDAVMALALIHHISISNNVPFEKVAEYFSNLAEYLIIEFVPKGDSKVETLLSTRKDIFDDYTQENFEDMFRNYYEILESIKIRDSLRTLYLMKRKVQ